MRGRRGRNGPVGEGTGKTDKGHFREGIRERYLRTYYMSGIGQTICKTFWVFRMCTQCLTELLSYMYEGGDYLLRRIFHAWPSRFRLGLRCLCGPAWHLLCLRMDHMSGGSSCGMTSTGFAFFHSMAAH